MLYVFSISYHGDLARLKEILLRDSENCGFRLHIPRYPINLAYTPLVALSNWRYSHLTEKTYATFIFLIISRHMHPFLSYREKNFFF